MEKRITGVQCNRCGKVFYPKRVCCLHCGGNVFEKVHLGDVWVVLTFTKLHVVPEGIKRVPLVFCIVKFADRATAVGQVTAENVGVGMKLKPVWELLRKIGGKGVCGFKFKPI